MAADFGFENYKALHRVLFEDLYEWAGKPRTIALSKTATVFTAPERIEELGGLIFARLKKLNYFTKLPQNEFISEISDLLMIGSIQAASGVMDTLVRFFEEI